MYICTWQRVHGVPNVKPYITCIMCKLEQYENIHAQDMCLFILQYITHVYYTCGVNIKPEYINSNTVVFIAAGSLKMITIASSRPIKELVKPREF